MTTRPTASSILTAKGLLLIGVLLLLGGFLIGWSMMIRMPGSSFHGALPPLTQEEERSRARLARDLFTLSGEIGERNLQNPSRLDAAATYIESTLKQIGYEVRPQAYTHEGQAFRNLEAVLPGRVHPEEIVLLGAHYDTVPGSPGADDNATGVAAILELGRILKEERFERTIRLVAFTNEEPPTYLTGEMGSHVYARAARARNDRIVAMYSIESIGYYSDAPGSQRYPSPLDRFYPDRGNFIAFVGNIRYGSLVRESLAAFRKRTPFPSEGAAAPAWLPGISWSDHASFWKEGYPAMMITDTVPFRNPHYHRPTDRPETVDTGRLVRVVHGLADVVRSVARGQEKEGQKPAP